MSEFAKGDYVKHIDEFGDGYYGRVAFVDEGGMVYVCFTTGCIAERRKPEWLRKIEPRPWMEHVRFGYHRFDDDCPDYNLDRCAAYCPEKGGE